MTINNILITMGVTLITGILLRRWRVYALMVISVFFLYWLQQDIKGIRHEFWLPTSLLGLIVFCWGAVSPPEERTKPQNIGTALAVIVQITILDVVLRLSPLGLSWIIAPPVSWYPSLMIAIIILMVWGMLWLSNRRQFLYWGIIALIISIFILVKLPSTSKIISELFVTLAVREGMEIPAFIPTISWFGFSYVAFRLLHTIRDRQMGKLGQVDLAEYITYVIFFPTLTAGPIDRIDRFLIDLRQPTPLDTQMWLDAGRRLMVGLFKKFFVANSLIVFAIGPSNVLDIHSTGWMWLCVYAYTFMIYFDFSGYTDIAIGLGRLLGFKLPENFSAPYLKPNITQFWNNWHMTLTQWFRAYFFNPIIRELRSPKRNLPIWLIILVTQLLTMIVIGLWHGITWNFVLWGLWHGTGLFVQNRWSEWFSRKVTAWSTTSLKMNLLQGANILITFNFVTLGWVFFALSEPDHIQHVFMKLFSFS